MCAALRTNTSTSSSSGLPSSFFLHGRQAALGGLGGALLDGPEPQVLGTGSPYRSDLYGMGVPPRLAQLQGLDSDFGIPKVDSMVEGIMRREGSMVQWLGGWPEWTKSSLMSLLALESLPDTSGHGDSGRGGETQWELFEKQEDGETGREGGRYS